MFMVPEGVNPALLEASKLFADARSVTAEIWPKVAFAIHSLLQRSARDPECKTPLHYVNLNARKLQEMIGHRFSTRILHALVGRLGVLERPKNYSAGNAAEQA